MSANQKRGFGRFAWWFLLLTSVELQAATTVFNSIENTDYSWTIDKSHWVAQGFVVDSNGPYPLESIDINIASSSTGFGEFEVSLWRGLNSDNSPKDHIVTLSGNLKPGSGIWNYTPPTSVTLAAQETYYVLCKVVSTWMGNSGSYNWHYDLSYAHVPTIRPGPGVTTGLTKTDTWGGTWDRYDEWTQAMRINVPEPTEWTFMGGVLCLGIAALRRFRQRRCPNPPRSA